MKKLILTAALCLFALTASAQFQRVKVRPIVFDEARAQCKLESEALERLSFDHCYGDEVGAPEISFEYLLDMTVREVFVLLDGGDEEVTLEDFKRLRDLLVMIIGRAQRIERLAD
jgi:hypothetical protein